MVAKARCSYWKAEGKGTSRNQEISTIWLPKQDLKNQEHQLTCQSKWGNFYEILSLDEELQPISG